MPLLNIPEEVIELRNTLRDFIEREIRPVEEPHREEILETGTFGALKEESLKLRKRSAELGFYTLHMPEDVGGGGLSLLGQVLLHEEAARQRPDPPAVRVDLPGDLRAVADLHGLHRAAAREVPRPADAAPTRRRASR